MIPLITGARAQPIYNIWIQPIRAKIIGEVDNILELYGTNLDWREIKTKLITHYSDWRDEASLSRDLWHLEQTASVEEFYGRISHTISLLVNLLNLTQENPAVKAAKQTYCQDIGLKVFL